MTKGLPKMVCPSCKIRLSQSEGGFLCESCDKLYPVLNGVPSFVKKEINFYHKYYLSEKGLKLARGHTGFKNPILNALLEIRAQVSIVGIRQRFFKKMLKKDRGALILDLGCGGGHELFTGHGSVVGVDVELAPLKNAAELYPMVAHADMSKLPFEDNVFDYVISSDVMEHIPPENKDAVLSEIWRVLKNGGKTLHAIETSSTNFLFRFAKKYPDMFRRSFIEEPGGHFGLEMPTDVLGRFKKHAFMLIRAGKIWGPIWSTEEYLYRFDNEYKKTAAVVRLLVYISRILNTNIVVHAAANVCLGILNYFLESVTPFNHAQAILVAYKKRE
ncbi:MAG: class I SAM-dependent methyltransferase [Candidatus Omnitrophica bacterium]|nr:class I SAM-dependent methyltransferase [Candidatus Omnitrophota bacterium]